MNLLIVEDEVQLADALAEILQRNKYHVDTVYNGEDGLHYASTGFMIVLFWISCCPF